MNKIRFRGKNAEGAWVEGSLIIDKYERTDGKQFDVAFIAEGLPCMEQSGDMWTTKMQRVKPETVGQFTGLHDKKGKPIYEGDIIKKHDPYNTITSDYTGYVVRFKGRWAVRHGDFLYNCNSDLFFDDFASHKQTVIGNIFDNADLYQNIEERIMNNIEKTTVE